MHCNSEEKYIFDDAVTYYTGLCVYHSADLQKQAQFSIIGSFEKVAVMNCPEIVAQLFVSYIYHIKKIMK